MEKLDNGGGSVFKQVLKKSDNVDNFVFNRVLEKLEYRTPKQQQAIVKLLFLSGCFNIDFFEHTINYARDINSKQNINRISLLKSKIGLKTNVTKTAFKENNFNYEIFNKLKLTEKEVLDWFIVSTQILWFNRKAEQERWEVEPLKWLVDYKDLITNLIKNTGIQEEIKPTKKEYDVIAVFGGAYKRTNERLNYLKNLIQSKNPNIENSKIYFLGGERTVTPEKDGGINFIQKLAKKYSKSIKSVNEKEQIIEWEKEGVVNTITEYDILNYLKKTQFNNSNSIIVVNAPKGQKKRPNTQDTIECMLKDYLEKGGNQKNILFISSQPYVKSQQNAVIDVFSNHKDYNYKYDVCGNKIEQVKLRSFIMALAGGAYGAYSRLIIEMGLKPNIKQVSYQKDLYKTIQEKRQQIRI